jgi:hypothetical protein
VRLNAVKHGIRSPAPIIGNVEDPKEWERHRRGVIESLDPDGHMEIVLAERVASLSWRLDRVLRYETDVINNSLVTMAKDIVRDKVVEKFIMGKPAPEPITPQDVDSAVIHRLLPRGNTLVNIQKYEAHLHRQMIQTLHELEAMQTRRRGGATTLARLDITRSPN